MDPLDYSNPSGGQHSRLCRISFRPSPFPLRAPEEYLGDLRSEFAPGLKCFARDLRREELSASLDSSACCRNWTFIPNPIINEEAQ